MYHVVKKNGYETVRRNFEHYEEAINKVLEYVRKNKDDSTTFVYLWENNRPDCSGDVRPPYGGDTTIILDLKGKRDIIILMQIIL